MNEYALYHGEEFIAVGSVKELAKRQNIKDESIRYYQTPRYLRRTKNGYRLIKLEDQ